MGPNSDTTIEVTLVECRKTAGRFCRMTLGVPVEPELHTPEARGAMTSGSRVVGALTLSRDQVQLVGADGQVGVQHLEDAGPLPLGKVPAHRDHGGPDLPAGEAGQQVSSELGRPTARRSADTETPLGEDVGQLGRPGVQLAPAHGLLGPVDAHEDDRPVVPPLVGQLAEPGPVGHLVLLPGPNSPAHHPNSSTPRSRLHLRRTGGMVARKGHFHLDIGGC